jgi:hypothetical protein
MKRILTVFTVALVVAAMMAVAVAVPGFAVGPFAGNSDSFKHQSNPCQGSGGKVPKCVGDENSYK